MARQKPQALSYGIVVLIIAEMLPAVARHYLHIHMPNPMGFMERAAEWAVGPGPSHPFPFTAVVLWTVVALVFPLASQLVVENAQV